MHRSRRFQPRLILPLGLALALMAGLAGTARATEIRGGDLVTIGADEVVDDDLLVSAQRVVVDGVVNGDLFAVGSEVEVNGTVNGSLFIAGQSLVVNGQVNGSVYAGGMEVDLGPTAAVGRNLLFGGFSLAATRGSSVERDLYMGGYQARLNGEIGRDVTFSGGALEINGQVGGDVTASVDSPDGGPGPMIMGPGMPALIPAGLRVGQDAEIEGDLNYTSPVDQASAIASQPGGQVAFATPVPGEGAGPVAQPDPQFRLLFSVLGWVFDRLRDFATLLVLGALAIWKLPGLLSQVTEKARALPLPSAGWGLLVTIVGYVGAAIVGLAILAVGVLFGIVTLGGLSQTVFGVGFSGLGLAFTVFSVLVAYGSKLIVSFLVGQWIVRRVLPNVRGGPWWALLIGVALYVFVRGIPLLGWLIGVIVTLVGLGAMWLVFRDRRLPAAAPAPMG